MARRKKLCANFNESKTGRAYKEKLGDKSEKKECRICSKLAVNSKTSFYYFSYAYDSTKMSKTEIWTLRGFSAYRAVSRSFLSM